jgi:hypothetical protein
VAETIKAAAIAANPFTSLSQLRKRLGEVFPFTLSRELLRDGLHERIFRESLITSLKILSCNPSTTKKYEQTARDMLKTPNIEVVGIDPGRSNIIYAVKVTATGAVQASRLKRVFAKFFNGLVSKGKKTVVAYGAAKFAPGGKGER